MVCYTGSNPLYWGLMNQNIESGYAPKSGKLEARLKSSKNNSENMFHAQKARNGPTNSALYKIPRYAYLLKRILDPGYKPNSSKIDSRTNDVVNKSANMYLWDELPHFSGGGASHYYPSLIISQFKKMQRQKPHCNLQVANPGMSPPNQKLTTI